MNEQIAIKFSKENSLWFDFRGFISIIQFIYRHKLSLLQVDIDADNEGFGFYRWSSFNNIV